MLKTNTKAVREKIKKYIIESFNDLAVLNYEEKPLYTFEEVQKKYWQIICKEKIGSIHYNNETFFKLFYNYSSFKLFDDWIRGLPTCFNGDFIYNVSAKELIKEWLEETEQEAEAYTEQEAEELAIKLLYRELIKNINIFDYMEG